MVAESMPDRVNAILAYKHPIQREAAMKVLRDTAPLQVQELLVRLMSASEVQIRRRASSLLPLFHETIEHEAEALAELLRQSDDLEVRLDCVTLLLTVQHPAAPAACLQALADPSPKVAMAACHYVGEEGDSASIAKLLEALNRPEWDVRLIACLALIKLQCTDLRLVATLEALSKSPEAAQHDRNEDEIRQLSREAGIVGASDLTWGSMASITAQARQIGQNVIMD